MADRHFPVRPNLDQLKHQAKDLLHAVRQGDPDAIPGSRRNPRPKGVLGNWLVIPGIGLADHGQVERTFPQKVRYGSRFA